jgi:NAD(P)-dependent dehydrogenase (short-subunit alcohol dehydrogenase family)
VAGAVGGDRVVGAVALAREPRALHTSAVRRTVLITGSSSGIGLATAVAFARRGDLVLATMRDPGRAGPLLEAAGTAGVEVEVLPLDVTDEGSATRCLDDVAQRHGALDVLVNNAGVGYSGSLEEISFDDVRQSMEVNFLGVARLTKAVLPSMRERGSGRIIAVSSMAGFLGQPFNDAYSAAKFAVEGLYEALHPVVATFGVHLSIVEPGPVAGEFLERSAGVDGSDDGPYAALWQRFNETREGGYDQAETSEDVAEVIVAAAEAEAPHLRYQTSPLVERLAARKFTDPTGDAMMKMTRRWVG